ncbi:MAG: hypothetical protein ACREMU_04085, partial [Gemmatimonadaceae bacterium]
MNCQEARDAMRDAEPGALAGTVPSTLAAHLAGCAACGALAESLTRDLHRLSIVVARRRVGDSRARRTRRVA